MTEKKKKYLWPKSQQHSWAFFICDKERKTYAQMMKASFGLFSWVLQHVDRPVVVEGGAVVVVGECGAGVVSAVPAQLGLKAMALAFSTLRPGQSHHSWPGVA